MEIMTKVRVGVTLPPELVEWLDGEVETRKYSDRSHAIEVAILTLKEKTEHKK
jgi:Arc/MetJ-type ribon-helix-helix transcriptional regulator